MRRALLAYLRNPAALLGAVLVLAVLAMGLAAFAALMVCELLLGLALGQGPAAILAAMARPEGILGLAGQVTFALLPLGFAVTQRLPRQ